MTDPALPSSPTTHQPSPPPPPFSPSTCTLITQGAEALLYRTHFLDVSTPAALKVRPCKPYRHPVLDRRLTKQRVLAEARVLVKLAGIRGAGAGGVRDGEVRVPGVLGVEWDVGRKVGGLEQGVRDVGREVGNGSGSGSAWLLMEWIEGKCVKDLLREWDRWIQSEGVSEAEKEGGQLDVKRLLRRVGWAVGAMHAKGGVVHGDLTSSNVMIRPVDANGVNGVTATQGEAETIAKPDLDGEIVLIDFGLAIQSTQEEDRAVDLYVLERAFGSTHPRQEGWFDQEVLQSQEGYRGSFAGARAVLKRLEDVRLRGRKRSMVG